MLTKFRLYYQIFKNMGWDYVQFRVFYTIRTKLGILKKQFPVSPSVKTHISLENWKNQDVSFFFDSKESLAFPKHKNSELKQRFDDFTQGKLWYFNSIQFNIGQNYDWLTNPENGYKYDINKHWSEVEDISEKAGDIKYVWEKSRFSYLYDIIRYDYHFGEDCSELVFSEIDNWIQSNPINQGPNYKCSQEISLRTLNWIFALYYFKNSPALEEERFQKITHVIYWQIKHDYANINFSRKTVRNNHAITECLMLYLGGLLFPFFPESNVWKTNGKKWFEQEIAYQIYEDGTFLQSSHNYHRVLVQLLTWGFYLADANNETFEAIVYDKAKKTLDYLYQCQELSNGYLPNYGANDGALFFRLNDAVYRDYRPQLNALYYFSSNKHLYETPESREDVYWYTSNKKNKVVNNNFELSHREISQFTEGGIYTMRDKDSLTFVKCASYKDRPSHADNLHIDIWYKGENILRDSGTYKYNTQPELIRYFSGTAGHNTVMLGDNDQMKKGPRFIWLNWSHRLNAGLKKGMNEIYFEGSIKAFKQLNSNISHTRKVVKHTNKPQWEIEDKVNHTTGLPIIQNWHIDAQFEEYFKIEAFDAKGVKLVPYQTRGYYSGQYGVKETTTIISFQTTLESIKTIIQQR
jgi:hypothetical protein